jgi:DNA-binding NtrC family response regulator
MAPPNLPDTLEVGDSFQPQVVVYLTDPALSDDLSQMLGERGHKTVQIEDLPTAYAVVTKLAPGVLVVDPSLTLKQNLRDLELLRKFTREQDCALIVLLAATRIELIDRLGKMRVDDLAEVTDPLHLLVYRVERMVELRRAKENLGKSIP